MEFCFTCLLLLLVCVCCELDSQCLLPFFCFLFFCFRVLTQIIFCSYCLYIRSSRYFSDTPSSSSSSATAEARSRDPTSTHDSFQDYDMRLRDDPTNVALWLEYADAVWSIFLYCFFPWSLLRGCAARWPNMSCCYLVLLIWSFFMLMLLLLLLSLYFLNMLACRIYSFNFICVAFVVTIPCRFLCIVYRMIKIFPCAFSFVFVVIVPPKVKGRIQRFFVPRSMFARLIESSGAKPKILWNLARLLGDISPSRVCATVHGYGWFLCSL